MTTHVNYKQVYTIITVSQVLLNNKIIFDRYSTVEYNDCMNCNDNISFQSVLDTAKLSEKQYVFFENLTRKDSETLGDIVSSYHKAGYTENPTSKYAAYRIYNSEKFQRVLSAYRRNERKKQDNREITMLERTSRDLQSIIERSESRGDLSTMRQAVMDRAKLHGLLVERHQVIDPTTELEVDKSMKIEAARIAEQRLLGHTMPVIDVDRIAETSNDKQETAITDE